MGCAPCAWHDDEDSCGHPSLSDNNPARGLLPCAQTAVAQLATPLTPRAQGLQWTNLPA